MKLFKSIRNITIIAAAMMFGVSVCQAKSAPEQVNKTIEASGFDAVRTSGQFEVTINTGAGFKVEANVPENMVRYLNIEVVNNRLVVKLKQNAPRYKGKLLCTVSMPKLAKLTASGQSSVKVNGDKFASDLVVKADGQSSVDFEEDVTVNSVVATAFGQSEIEMEKVSVKTLQANAGGQAALKFEAVKTNEGSLASEGQSILKVEDCVASKMSADASGQSVLVVKGLDCPDFSQNKSGQSTLKVSRK